MAKLRESVKRVWRWLTSGFGPHLCESCSGSLRRLAPADLAPEAVRAHRLAGTLGGLLAGAYVCRTCTERGGWVLVE